MTRFACVAVVVCAAFARSLWAAEPANPDFDREIAPLLARSCLGCHSGAEPKGGLDLTSRRSTLAGGDSGVVLVPGKPDESDLWDYVQSEQMPPKKPLAAADKELLRKWIAEGAKWGTDPIDPLATSTAARAGYDWWSLQSIRRPAVPAVKAADWPKNDIDRFVLAKLEEHALSPATPADRRTLIRRLAFDLTGLPPSPEEVEKFINDTSPEAYAALVERLLASPAYGERWARHWLDIAHFGESDGFEFDRLRPNAWPYRDWVVNALDANMPFDEFTRLQLAGDVLRPDDPEALKATGFLVGGTHDSLMPAGDTMRQIMRQDELEDLIGLVGQTFLGLTVQCARCHDHKFDPIRQSDYYRLSAALAGVHRGERPIPTPAESAPLQKQLAEYRAQLEDLDTRARKLVLARRGTDADNRPVPPQPLAAWEFANGLGDIVGKMDAKLVGGARLDQGKLVVDGKDAYAVTEPLPRDLTAKTLEAWVQLGNLDQRGGAAISLETPDGGLFDAIVFGEKDPQRWMAGSEGFTRTQPFNGAAETDAHARAVHVAIVYSADGTITAYRNGQLYGKPYKTTVRSFAAGKARVIFGLRHSPVGGNKMLTGAIERARLYDRALTPDEVAASAGGEFISEAELAATLNAADRARREQLQRQVAETDERLAQYRDLKVFSVTPKTPAVVHVLARGNPLQKGEVVTAGGLGTIPGLPGEFGLATETGDADRRRKLADWITDERNPLFARTIVNRVWQYHFGSGLIETPSDLGFNGGHPSHPELLDYLATEFTDRGFRLKDLHRLIVTSATYQQSSLPNAEAVRIDANNRWLWRKSPVRLEAEVIRDAILVISGQLNPRRGGPGYQDFRPFLRGGTQFYEILDPVGPEFNRRSLYRTWARGGHNPLLDTFDCPDPSTFSPRRNATNTPLQALSLMNNSFVLRMSEALAERLQREAGDDPGRQVTRAYELTYGRPPRNEERALAVVFVREHGLSAFGRVLFNTNEFLYVR
jgi:hypothetical protein